MHQTMLHIASSNRRSKSAAVHGPRVGLVADVGHRDLHQPRDLLALDAVRAELAGDADALLQRRAARARTPAPPPATPPTCASSSNFCRHRLDVPGQHGVDHQRVGQAVVQVADGAERVRAGVHRAEVLLERDRAHHRAHHHVGARLQVARLAHRGDAARARRCACPRARCRRTAGGRRATGSSRRCASARPCRWPPSRAAGRPSVSSGSANTTLASICGENTIRLTCVSSSLMTAERPTSRAGARGRRQGDEVRQRRARSAAPAGGPRRIR